MKINVLLIVGLICGIISIILLLTSGYSFMYPQKIKELNIDPGALSFFSFYMGFCGLGGTCVSYIVLKNNR